MNINIKKENVKNLENNLLKLRKFRFTNDNLNELINQIIELNSSILKDYKKFLYHKKQKKNKITDEKIEKAINMIEEHKISKKIIAQKYKISVPTLTKYINQKKVKNTVNFNQSEINNLTNNNNNMKAEDLGEDSAEDLDRFASGLAIKFKKTIRKKREQKNIEQENINNIENKSNENLDITSNANYSNIDYKLNRI